MSDIDQSALNALRDSKRKKRLNIENQPWGYVIRSGHRTPLDVLVGQGLAYFFGVCLIIAALGIMFMPGLFSSADMGVMRIGAATLFGAGAVYLLWFATRGGRVDVEVDSKGREIREVIQNRTGKPTIISTYPFDDIGGIYLEAAGGTAPEQLLMGYHGQMILLAEGETDELTALRTQLSRDLMSAMGLDIARVAVEAARDPEQKRGKAA